MGGPWALPIAVPIPHCGRGCCQAPASPLARVGLDPGGSPGAAGAAHPLAMPLAQMMPAVPPLTSTSLKGCGAGDAGAVPQGKDVPSALGSLDPGSMAWGMPPRDAEPLEVRGWGCSRGRWIQVGKGVGIFSLPVFILLRESPRESHNPGITWPPSSVPVLSLVRLGPGKVTAECSRRTQWDVGAAPATSQPYPMPFLPHSLSHSSSTLLHIYVPLLLPHATTVCPMAGPQLPPGPPQDPLCPLQHVLGRCGVPPILCELQG